MEACSSAFGIPVHDNFNDVIRERGNLTPSTGFLPIAYNPDNGHRSSASVAYVHPLLREEESRPNLTILTNAWVEKINMEGSKVCEKMSHTARARHS